MPAQYLLPVVYPPFELLKKSAGILHFIGASVILINGLHALQQHGADKLSCYLQVIIAAEIYLILIPGKSLLVASPGLNVFFRIIESLTLMGIGFALISYGHVISGWVHSLLSLGYLFLFYREWRMMCSESVNIAHTGISVPNFIMEMEITWPEIRSIVPGYQSIFIETFRNKRIHFQLRKNLKIEELQQIDEFCRQHLMSSQSPELEYSY